VRRRPGQTPRAWPAGAKGRAVRTSHPPDRSTDGPHVRRPQPPSPSDDRPRRMNAPISKALNDANELYDALWCAALRHRPGPGTPLTLSQELEERVNRVFRLVKPFEVA